MTDDVCVIETKDVFTYTDLYRRLKVESGDYVNKEKERLVERYWNVEERPSSYWAKLRAHEHALEWIQHRREPGTVVFGETDEEGKPGGGLLEQRTDELRQCREESAQLMRQMKQYREREEEWQAELVQRNQSVARCERRLSQTQSTFVVVGLTLLSVIVIQFIILMSR